ncbi:MAG: hypothetical protein HY775_03880 [Acidobacteria bacterium]|nr:hypothetical protein [Acidobacteriota bacterium]
MSPALSYLLLGTVLAVTLGFVAWLRQRRLRSPAESVEDFRRALRALSGPPARRRRSV